MARNIYLCVATRRPSSWELASDDPDVSCLLAQRKPFKVHVRDMSVECRGSRTSQGQAGEPPAWRVPDEVADLLGLSTSESPQEKVYLRFMTSDRIRIALSKKELIKCRQKDREWPYLLSFLEVADLHPREVKECEAPDFLLSSGSEKIGIEVTEYCSDAIGSSGRPRIQVDQQWRAVQQKMREGRNTRPTLTHVHAHITFRELQVPSHRETDSFVTELLDFTERLLPEITSEERAFRVSDEEPGLLKKYVRSLECRKTACELVIWDWNHCAAFIGLREEELLEMLRAKMQTSFGEPADEYWLLIASGTELSQAMHRLHADELNSFSEVTEALSKYPFQKVYVHNCAHEQIFVWEKGKGWTDVLTGIEMAQCES